MKTYNYGYYTMKWNCHGHDIIIYAKWFITHWYAHCHLHGIRSEANMILIKKWDLILIMSRGFELKEAMKLMVRAKFNKILEKIEDDELKNKILEEINQRLD